MKLVKQSIHLSLLLLLIAGCSANTADENETEQSGNAADTETVEESASSGEADQEKEVIETEESDGDAQESDATVEEDRLSQYAAEQIEYARVWLQLGANQEIDELNLHHIPAGTTLNPKDDTSGVYPEDVIQLAGSRLVDGSVTYSGNGDGTINVYNVPLRWDGVYPVGDENFYTELIENTEQVYIETGDPEEVERLIELLEDKT
ncbi:hypothetical protein KP77_10830 [Jeotgalibacillus alimentarius]|uniref:Lipoprotein n=1 Tax=Jeotgalibacillus alimentarius TaxID=135826 RepID=A0A0C2W4Q5_9BACL|nr:hypothetical protein [Jeotgalibacillus alimentarius]KIL51571.1 hypothetical protein KP77_10830 [Jeotgalibacillus alimentarius]